MITGKKIKMKIKKSKKDKEVIFLKGFCYWPKVVSVFISFYL